MKIIFAFALLFALGPAADAADGCRNANPNWFTCSETSDCVLVSDPCGAPRESAHQKFASLAEKCFIREGAAISCPSGGEGKNGKAAAICEAKQCVAKIDSQSPSQAFKSVITPMKRSQCFDQKGQAIHRNHCVCYPSKAPCRKDAKTSTCAQDSCSQWTCQTDKDCAAISAKCVEAFCQ